MNVWKRKQKLRSEIRKSLFSCKTEELLRRSVKIRDILAVEVAQRSPRRVFLYLEMVREVKISPIISWLSGQGILVFVPFKQKNEWHVAQITRETKINFGKGKVAQSTLQSILQPIPQPIMPVEVKKSLADFGFVSSDIAVVPGLVFSKSGKRLGRGGGVYDAYLSDCEVFKIGVCFDFQLREDIPQDTRDVPMNLVISG